MKYLIHKDEIKVGVAMPMNEPYASVPLGDKTTSHFETGRTKKEALRKLKRWLKENEK